MLNVAVEEQLLKTNPAPGIARVMREARSRTQKEVGRPDAWSREEAARIIELARRHEPSLYVPLFLAIHTGARRGELVALKWEDVDF